MLVQLLIGWTLLLLTNCKSEDLRQASSNIRDWCTAHFSEVRLLSINGVMSESSPKGAQRGRMRPGDGRYFLSIREELYVSVSVDFGGTLDIGGILAE